MLFDFYFLFFSVVNVAKAFLSAVVP